MAPDVDAVLVNYHAEGWLASAVRALRADWAEAGLSGRVIVVDNGSTAAERAAFPALEAVVIDAGCNRGFAAGANLGIAAGSAPAVLLVNPDVEVHPGCTRALLDELHGGAAAAGPRFFWDRGRRFLLPPTEPTDRAYRLLQRAGRRNAACLKRARARWRCHARRHWRASAPLSSEALSGALLALRRDAWNAVGPFDDGFFMYFEEVDWLRRLRRRGWQALHVPAARAVHHFARSTHDPEAAARHFRASEQRFFAGLHGTRTSRLLQRIADRAPCSRAAAPTPWHPCREQLAWPRAARDGEGDRWVELSPSAGGFPAAGHRWPRGEGDLWLLPEEIWAQLDAGSYTVTVTDDKDREVLHHGFTKPPPG